MAEYYGPAYSEFDKETYGPPTSTKYSTGYSSSVEITGQPFQYPTTYQDSDAAYINLESQFQWRAWVSQNKAIILDVYGRWRPQGSPNLNDNELMMLAQGGPAAEPLYEEYELFRKYESFRPLFWNYYGKEATREEIQNAVDTFVTPERMQDHIDYHRKAQSVWMDYYGRPITANELNKLRTGQTVPLPKQS